MASILQERVRQVYKYIFAMHRIYRLCFIEMEERRMSYENVPLPAHFQTVSDALTLNNLVSGTAFAAVAASPFWVPALAAGKRRRRRRNAEAGVADFGKAIQLENEVNNLSLLLK